MKALQTIFMLAESPSILAIQSDTPVAQMISCKDDIQLRLSQMLSSFHLLFGCSCLH